MHYGTRLWDLACCISLGGDSFGFYDEFFEKIENKTFDSFVEENYKKGGAELEAIEKKYLIDMVRFRHMEAIGWILEQMKEALIDQDEFKYEQFRTILLQRIPKIEKLMNIQINEAQSPS